LSNNHELLSRRKKPTSHFSLQRRLSILNKLKIQTLPPLQKEKKELKTSPIKNQPSLSENKNFSIKPHGTYLKKIINSKKNCEGIKQNTSPKFDNEAPEKELCSGLLKKEFSQGSQKVFKEI
jgi:hypothetical protein